MMREPASAPVIRPAGPADLDTLAAIGVRTYLDHFRDIWSPEGLQRFLADSFGRERLAADLAPDGPVRYALLQVGADVLGFAKIIRDRPLPIAPHRAGLELQKIYFTKESTGRGYGTALMHEVLRTADEQGQACVWLDVLKGNRAGIRFYERLGFTRVGEVAFATDRCPLDMWVMLHERP